MVRETFVKFRKVVLESSLVTDTVCWNACVCCSFRFTQAEEEAAAAEVAAVAAEAG